MHDPIITNDYFEVEIRTSNSRAPYQNITSRRDINVDSRVMPCVGWISEAAIMQTYFEQSANLVAHFFEATLPVRLLILSLVQMGWPFFL